MAGRIKIGESINEKQNRLSAIKKSSVKPINKTTQVLKNQCIRQNKKSKRVRDCPKMC